MRKFILLLLLLVPTLCFAGDKVKIIKPGTGYLDSRYLRKDQDDSNSSYTLSLGKLGILETGATPTKYTYLQGGDQTADLTYTLPTAYPAVSNYPLISSTAGVLGWNDQALLTTSNVQFNSLGVNVAATGVAGEIKTQVISDTATDTSKLLFYRARARGAAVANGDVIGAILGYAYDGTAYKEIGSLMYVMIDGTVQQGITPVSITFATSDTYGNNNAVLSLLPNTSAEFYSNVKLNGTLGILETGASPTKYTYLQGGDQTVDLTYTLPTAFPASDGMILNSTTVGVWSWGGNLTIGGYYTEYAEISTPSTPAADALRLYAKDDGAGTSRIYIIDDAGIETDLTGGGGGATTLDALTDVIITTPSDNQGLTYDNATSQWINEQIDHTTLSNIGTNTHATVDTHLANTSNPHSVTAAQASAVALTGNETIAGIKTFSSFPILPSSTPTTDYQAVHKSYVDAFSQGLEVKLACRVATTTAGTLATSFENGDTIDGIVLATGDRILIKDQADATTNGIYTVNASGAPTRATDYDVTSEVQEGTYTFITAGTANGGYQFVQITKDPVLNTNNLVFTYLNKTTLYTASLGVELVSSDFRADLLSTGAIGLTGNELKVNIDDSSIGITTNALYVKALGITYGMLAGSIPDSKLDTISTASKVSGAALTSLTSVPSGAGVVPIANLASGTPDGTKFVRDDNTLAVPTAVGGVNAAIMDVDFLSANRSGTGSQTAQWTNLPAAAQELFNSNAWRNKVDLTYATHYRIVVNQTVAGYSTSDCNLQYSTDNSTYVAADTAVAGELAIGAGTGIKVGAWAELVTGAKQDVWLRITGKEGNGTIDPAFSQIRVQFKMLSTGGAAPTNATYVTLSADATLTLERILTGTTNQITVTDAGAGSTVTLSTPQNIHTSASPTFVGLTLSGAIATPTTITTSGNITSGGNVYTAGTTTRGLVEGTGIHLQYDADDFLDVRNAANYWQISGVWEYEILPGAISSYTTLANDLGTTVKIWNNLYVNNAVMGSSTNSVTSTTTGTTYAGTARPQRSFYVDVGGMLTAVTTGSGAITQTETTTNKVNYLSSSFDGATDTIICFTSPLPKTWNAGTVTAVIYYIPAGTTTGTGIVWTIAGVLIGDNVSPDTAYGTAVSVTDTIQTAARVHISPESGAITIGGTLSGEKQIFWRVTRDADAAGDTNTDAAGLLGVLIKYTATGETDS